MVDDMNTYSPRCLNFIGTAVEALKALAPA